MSSPKPSARRLVGALALLVVLAVAGYLARGGGGPASETKGDAPPPATSTSTSTAADASNAKPAAARGYAPRGPTPAEAIPGGGLQANEGIAGAHTLARHVGKSQKDLEDRAAREGKREVSSFPDVATADRAVAETLWRRRADVARWLERGPRANEDFETRLDWVAGTVWRTSAGRLSDGHTVRVVLVPSKRFPEGFSVLTAYVSLP